MQEEDGRRRGVFRALGLLVLTLALSVVQPAMLMALPFVLLTVFLPGRSKRLLVGGALALLLVVGGGPHGSMWWVERGWAILLGGWFVGLTLRWPRSRFFPRGLGAVVGSYAVAALLFQTRPGSWPVVEWMVTDRMREGASTALTAIRSVGGAGSLPSELTDAIYRTLETQGVVFPALLGLGSLAALGVAWWAWSRLADSAGDALGPLRDFRFNDQLVWIFVAGLAMVLLRGSGVWDRVGTNAVVFMGALYALRGAAVLLFLSGGVSLLGSLLLALAVLFVAPVIAAAALVVGLGDTWLDLRERARHAAQSDG